MNPSGAAHSAVGAVPRGSAQTQGHPKSSLLSAANPSWQISACQEWDWTWGHSQLLPPLGHCGEAKEAEMKPLTLPGHTCIVLLLPQDSSSLLFASAWALHSPSQESWETRIRAESLLRNEIIKTKAQCDWNPRQPSLSRGCFQNSGLLLTVCCNTSQFL